MGFSVCWSKSKAMKMKWNTYGKWPSYVENDKLYQYSIGLTVSSPIFDQFFFFLVKDLDIEKSSFIGGKIRVSLACQVAQIISIEHENIFP